LKVKDRMPPTLMSDESHIRVLTLNCWYLSSQRRTEQLLNVHKFLRGLKYIAKNLTERIESIAQQLANSDHDIITLQEIWVFSHYEHVRQSVSKRLPYSKFFYRYVFFDSQNVQRSK
jgi:sphingomyelin phosphodiesterase 2